MIQKRNISTFAIVAALSIFLVAPTSQANFKRTHTPGETVGPTARPPISSTSMSAPYQRYFGVSDSNKCTKLVSCVCEVKLIEADPAFDNKISTPPYL